MCRGWPSPDGRYTPQYLPDRSNVADGECGPDSDVSSRSNLPLFDDLVGKRKQRVGHL
jgi:hypothetical protein